MDQMSKRPAIMGTMVIILFALLALAAVVAGQKSGREADCVFPPAWTIDDHSPIKESRGNVTVLALLLPSCPMCRKQAKDLEAMRKHYVSHGLHDINFITVNHWSGEDAKQQIKDNINFPFYQSTQDNDVWAHLEGHKGDLFVYDRCGRQAYFIPFPRSLLVYSFVEKAIMNTYNNNPCGECPKDTVRYGAEGGKGPKFLEEDEFTSWRLTQQKEGDILIAEKFLKANNVTEESLSSDETFIDDNNSTDALINRDADKHTTISPEDNDQVIHGAHFQQNQTAELPDSDLQVSSQNVTHENQLDPSASDGEDHGVNYVTPEDAPGSGDGTNKSQIELLNYSLEELHEAENISHEILTDSPADSIHEGQGVDDVTDDTQIAIPSPASEKGDELPLTTVGSFIDVMTEPTPSPDQNGTSVDKTPDSEDPRDELPQTTASNFDDNMITESSPSPDQKVTHEKSAPLDSDREDHGVNDVTPEEAPGSGDGTNESRIELLNYSLEELHEAENISHEILTDSSAEGQGADDVTDDTQIAIPSPASEKGDELPLTTVGSFIDVMTEPTPSPDQNGTSVDKTPDSEDPRDELPQTTASNFDDNMITESSPDQKVTHEKSAPSDSDG